VEYPLSVRTPDTKVGGCKYYQLVYRNLTLLGFKTGAPNRILCPDIFKRYLQALGKAVDAIGAAGVIHGDLYISNVMYKIDSQDGSVKIKIIDWDSAHCLEEKKFEKKAKKRLGNFFGSIDQVKFTVKHDQMYVVALSQDIKDEDTIWRNLACGEKEKMDSAFTYLLFRSLNLSY
jgi:serine/threonine protein kinase